MNDHCHCPEHGDDPKAQPFLTNDGRQLCGWCWYYRGAEVEMVECTPETCPND